MTEHLHKTYDMLDQELETVMSKGDLTPQTIDMIDVLSHAMKNIKTIVAMEESEHRNRGYDRGYYGSRMR